MLRATLKIGKKLCFPDVPCSWFRNTVRNIELVQHHESRKAMLFPYRRSECGWDGWGEGFDNTNISSMNGDEYEAEDEDECEYEQSFYYSSQWIKFGLRLGQDDCYSWCYDNQEKILKFLEDEAEAAANGSTVTSTETLKGKPFDVVSLLSMSKNDDSYLVRNNGEMVKVESLRGKKILICCFNVPVFWLSRQAFLIRDIPTIASASECCDEMVVVVRMRRSWANDEDAFNHFLSGFPSSCLTVPFSHLLRRDYVCNSIALHPRHPQAILVDDSQQLVLAHRSLFSYQSFLDFVSYECLEPEDCPSWWKAHSRLDLLLDSPPDRLLCSTSGGKCISISQLKEKLVGLYLCYDGHFIRKIDVISRECKARNLEFEIVLLYLPYEEGVNPQLFQQAINQVLHNLNISDWWVSPFNDFVSRRLWDICGTIFGEDQLIIVQPGYFPEPYGLQVIHIFGINAYPFTRESVIRRELKALKALTLESLLVYGSRDYVLRPRNNGNGFDPVPVAELQGKIVFLYVSHVQSPKLCLYNPLLQWYKNRDDMTRENFEVVLVHLDAGDRDSKEFGRAMPMPWLSCPFDPKHTAFVKRHLLKERWSVLTAFGKDGHIITFDALGLLEDSPHGFPSHESEYDGLRNEIIAYLEHSSGVIDITYGDLKTWIDYGCSNMNAV